MAPKRGRRHPEHPDGQLLPPDDPTAQQHPQQHQQQPHQSTNADDPAGPATGPPSGGYHQPQQPQQRGTTYGSIHVPLPASPELLLQQQQHLAAMNQQFASSGPRSASPSLSRSPVSVPLSPTGSLSHMFGGPVGSPPSSRTPSRGGLMPQAPLVHGLPLYATDDEMEEESHLLLMAPPPSTPGGPLGRPPPIVPIFTTPDPHFHSSIAAAAAADASGGATVAGNILTGAPGAHFITQSSGGLHGPCCCSYRVMATVLILAACLLALASGTPNAFNFVADELHRTYGYSHVYIGLLTGVGMAGVFVTVPAGILADLYGPAAAAAAGCVAVTGGYFGMSYVPEHPAVLLVCLAVVGMGSGCTFLSALSAAMALQSVIAVVLVSLCMSLSLSCTLFAFQIYDAYIVPGAGPSDQLWMLAAAVGVCTILGTVGLASTAHIGTGARTLGRMPHALPRNPTCAEYMRILSHGWFWCMFMANMFGMLSGVALVSSASTIWRSFSSSSDVSLWRTRMMVIFSIANALGNVVSPLLADKLQRKGVCSRNRFTGGVLGLMALVWAALGVMKLVSDGSSPAACWLFVVLAGAVGYGFGSYLTLFPVMLGDAYGVHNFSTNMSMLQCGSALAALCGAGFATFTAAQPVLYFAVTALLLVGGALVWCPNTSQYHHLAEEGVSHIFQLLP